MKFLYMPIDYNNSSRNGAKVEWIVIHDTGNSGKGADALAHQKYFGGGNRNASAHYFVDDQRIVQIIGDDLSAWHCGDDQGKGKYLNGAMNRNSIGIELCINSDGDYDKAYKNLVELTKNLMHKFGISAERVCRHYDVSRKRCPGTFFDKGLWDSFKAEIQKPIEWVMDLSKSSEFGPDKIVEETKDTEPSQWAKEAWGWATKEGITDGSDPKRTCTREEVIVMINRALKLKKG